MLTAAPRFGAEIGLAHGLQDQLVVPLRQSTKFVWIRVRDVDDGRRASFVC